MEDYEYVYTNENNKYAYFISKDIVEDGKEAYNVLVKYDLDSSEIVAKRDIVSSDYAIDYDNFDIYYINYKNDKAYIYKNDQKLYSFDKERVRLLARTNKTLLLYDDSNLYKFDLSKKKIVETVKSKLEGFYGLSDLSGKYFHVIGNIYMYNDNIKNLNVIIDENTGGIYNVDDFGNNVVFYNHDTSDITVYNKVNKKYEIYENAKYSYDYKNSKLYVTVDNKIIEVK